MVLLVSAKECLRRDVPLIGPGKRLAPILPDSYKPLRLRRCTRKNTSTPLATINNAVSMITIRVLLSFEEQPRSGKYLIIFFGPLAAACPF